MRLIVFYIAIFCSAVMLTWVIRRYALATQLLDIPNARSSHKKPTPRGGGLAFVFIFSLALLILSFWHLTDGQFTLAAFLAGSLVALLGYIDDRQGLSAKLRLAGHFAAAAFSLIICNPITTIDLGYFIITNTVLLGVFSLIYLVWLLNLFNFMDGIDGLAASETVFACIAASCLYYLNNDQALVYLPCTLALAVGGFLYWNFPPAKIFMGDVGSGFLGFLIGLFILQATHVKPEYFWSWTVLLGVFIVDASLTLLRRAVNGNCLWQAHCNHAYQHAARYYGCHRIVTLAVLLINSIWLFPWSILISKGLIDGFVATLIAFLPLIFIALKFNAGIEG